MEALFMVFQPPSIFSAGLGWAFLPYSLRLRADLPTVSSSSTPGCFALWCLDLEIRWQPLMMIILSLDYFLPLRSQHRGSIEDIGQSCSSPLSSTKFQTHDRSIKRSQDVTYPSNESLLLICFRSNSAKTKPLDFTHCLVWRSVMSM